MKNFLFVALTLTLTQSVFARAVSQQVTNIDVSECYVNVTPSRSVNFGITNFCFDLTQEVTRTTISPGQEAQKNVSTRVRKVCGHSNERACEISRNSVELN